MAFQLEVSQELHIDGMTYAAAEHPTAPGIPYGQEGRAVAAYQLVAPGGEVQAINLFKPRPPPPVCSGEPDKQNVLDLTRRARICGPAIYTRR
ncbi:MAG: hypothetical protein SXV54_18080 [Chloroflexota bacterium]|nr:hypothetical protein [Chloroflexota bacterium]